MTTKSRWLVFLISTPLVALVTLGGLLSANSAEPFNQDGFPHLRTFNNVVSLVYEAYVEPVDVNRVMDGAMRGLADSLDPSSAFLTPDELRAFDGGAASSEAGIGTTITRQFYLRVVGVRDDSPAARAGLRTGDYIRAIDDQPTRDMSVVTGRRLLGGEAGSTVRLLVIRSNAADPHEVTLTREAPSGEPVATTTSEGTPVVRVRSFASGIAPLREAISALGAAAASGVVIDLRGTSDGAPEVGAEAARLFIDSGTVATLAGRNVEPVVTAAGDGDGAFAMPVVLVVSNGTAHAAEVFAAAMADHERAQLVGQPTAGLAGVQKLVPLPDRHALWMTHARYVRLDGTPIHEQGVLPTTGVAEPYVEFGEDPPSGDRVLERAISVLKSGR